jgi:predicted phosphoribosyltransferase
MPFKDRADAGRKLAVALAGYKDQQPVVLALPRGGVPVAAEVAAALNAPLDLILVRKIGVPYQPELAMGAVVDGDEPLVVRNEDVIRFAGIDESEFNAVCDSELAEIERRRQRYLGSRERVEVAGRAAIVIDDGIATGATTCARTAGHPYSQAEEPHPCSTCRSDRQPCCNAAGGRRSCMS